MDRDLVKEDNSPPPDTAIRYQLSSRYINERLKWQIIVERWSWVFNRNVHGEVVPTGSRGRKYLAQFTEQEREKIGKYHKIFHNWLLHSGQPDQSEVVHPSDFALLTRAVHFFALV